MNQVLLYTAPPAVPSHNGCYCFPCCCCYTSPNGACPSGCCCCPGCWTGSGRLSSIIKLRILDSCFRQGILNCLLDQAISHVKYAPVCTISKSILQKFSGEGLTEPPPQTPPPALVSGFALDSSFALNSRALRALDSGFALNSRVLRALDSDFTLSFHTLLGGSARFIHLPPKI